MRIDLFWSGMMVQLNKKVLSEAELERLRGLVLSGASAARVSVALKRRSKL
jgi:hypothetical protein